MSIKPDKNLLLYAVLLTAAVCAFLSGTAAALLPHDLIPLAAAVIGAVFLLSAVYLVLLWHFTLYVLTDKYIKIISGIVFRRTVYIYTERETVLYRMSLPFKCGFTVIRTIGGGAVLLTNADAIEERLK